jgi:hypothetical protein
MGQRTTVVDTGSKKDLRGGLMKPAGGQKRQNLSSPDKVDKQRIATHNRCQSEKKQGSFKQPGGLSNID